MTQKSSHYDVIRLMYEAADNGRLFFDEKRCNKAILHAPASGEHPDPVFIVNDRMKFFHCPKEKAIILIQEEDEIICLAMQNGERSIYRYKSDVIPTWILN